MRQTLLPIWGIVLCLPICSTVWGAEAVASKPQRPNIILIMTDDMGYSDLNCYGGDAQTPNLNQLAESGVRFTQFYNTARCCPTRASLMTGLYPHQAGVGHMMNDRGYEGYQGNLNRESVTIAEVLKPAGYRTYMCGKWHVTRHTSPDGDRSNWPLQRGFDKYYGTLDGAGNFFRPHSLHRQNQPITHDTDPEYSSEEYYYTDALSDNAVKYLKEHQTESPDKPFFLYVAYTAAHWPMHALEKDIAKYHGKFDRDYDHYRQGRLQRMKELGVIAADSQLTPGAEDWNAVTHKEWEARCMEVYSAMIDNMDAGVGRIVKQLQASGQLENTLILFLQDNGGCAELLGRSPVPPKTGHAANHKTGPEHMPGPADTYIAYGRGWANVSNTPFREYKHWVHEGGISTPLIAHWPAGISESRRGQLEHQPGHLVDIMATAVDLGEAEYPEKVGQHSIKPREGVSLSPAFQGQNLNRKNPLFWEHEGNRAIRDGRWKLVAKENEPWELYDIQQDRTELNNLAKTHPERVKQLAAAWEAYAERANVLPLGAWRGKQYVQQQQNTPFTLTLKAGETRNQEAAPDLTARAFTVRTEIELSSNNPQGVIVAQGGSQLGYSLYLDQARPVFFVRTPQETFQVTGKALSAGKHTLTARLNANGQLSLQGNDEPLADPVEGSLIPKQPVDGLQIGRDTGGAVGLYKTPNAFTDTIHSVSLKFEARKTTAE